MTQTPRSIVELLIQQSALKHGFIHARRFPVAFRRDLARLVHDGETSVERVSAILGVTPATVRRWVHELRDAHQEEPGRAHA